MHARYYFGSLIRIAGPMGSRVCTALWAMHALLLCRLPYCPRTPRGVLALAREAA